MFVIPDIGDRAEEVAAGFEFWEQSAEASFRVDQVFQDIVHYNQVEISVRKFVYGIFNRGIDDPVNPLPGLAGGIIVGLYTPDLRTVSVHEASGEKSRSTANI